MKMQCLIVDDEPLARKVLLELIEDIEFVELAGVAANVYKAAEIINSVKIDLVFLDVQMPKMNGIEFIKANKKLPPVILTTAYSDFAVEGYELNILDYLVKPITSERFYKAVVKAREHIGLLHHSTDSKIKQCLFVKHNGKYEKLNFDEILFVEASSNYVQVHSVNGKILLYSTLKNIQEQLPPECFVQIHKSYVVALNKILRFDMEQIFVGQHALPLSRNFKENFMSVIQNKFGVG